MTSRYDVQLHGQASPVLGALPSLRKSRQRGRAVYAWVIIAGVAVLLAACETPRTFSHAQSEDRLDPLCTQHLDCAGSSRNQMRVPGLIPASQRRSQANFMNAHKFDVGVVVAFWPAQKWLSSEDYTVVRQLPPGDDRKVQYRLRSIATGQERVAREDQLKLRTAA